MRRRSAWASGSRRPDQSIIRTPQQRGNCFVALAEGSKKWRREYPYGSSLHTSRGRRRECPAVCAPHTMGRDRCDFSSVQAPLTFGRKTRECLAVRISLTWEGGRREFPSAYTPILQPAVI